MAPKPALPKPQPAEPRVVPADEAALLESVALSAPQGFWSRMRRGFERAFRVVTVQEFTRCAEGIVTHLDGEPISPEEAQRRCVRLMEAHTGMTCVAAVAKCQVSDTAVLVIHMGGLYFARALKLRNPKEARRG